MEIYIELAKNPSLDTIDMGGGFGINYEKKKFYTAKTVTKNIINLIKKWPIKPGTNTRI